MVNLPTSDWMPPDDPIFGLSVAFRKDPNPKKVNLGVGAYRTSTGEPLVLSSVRNAEKVLLEKKLNKEYLPIDGDADFVRLTSELIFDDLTTSLPLFGAQMVGGTGSLRMGAEYLALGQPKTIYLSTPTWANHKNIFGRSGLQVQHYPYYDSSKADIDFSVMCQALNSMPAGSAVLLHGCCHNPTGIDLSLEQWRQVSAIIKSRHLIPFFDLAYQGLGEGLDADAAAVRLFAKDGHELLVSYSFAKNFGLYNERVGFLGIVTADRSTAEVVGKQLKTMIRASYSNPPSQGERIVSIILQSESLKKEWAQELELMRHRVIEMRKTLISGLQARGLGGNHHVLMNQKGLFSYGLLHKEEVRRLRQEFAIYCPDDGRINVAGLNPQNISYVIDAIEAVSVTMQ